MPVNLPPILPSSRPTPVSSGNSLGGLNRAQNFSTSKLQQHKDRENAKVSVGDDRSSRAVSSIHRVGQVQSGATTSVNRASNAQSSINANEAERDEKRYAHSLFMLRKKKIAERRAQRNQILSNFSSDDDAQAKK